VLKISSRTVAYARRRRWLCLALFDCGAWGIAVGLAAFARLDFKADQVAWGRALLAWIFVCLLYLALAWSARLHRGRATLGSLEEMILLSAVTVPAAAVLFFVNLITDRAFLPLSVPVTATFVALAIMGWGRAIWRNLRQPGVRRRLDAEGDVRVLILGAGDAGRQLIRSMHRDVSRRWHPVGLIDDYPHKRFLRIHGVPVLGTFDNIATVAADTRASLLVLAIPSADASLIRKASDAAAAVSLDIKVLPAVSELLGGRVGVQDIREIQTRDLLGRREIDVDLDAIASYLTGQRVLVTGAGGSIGSELCRQISRWKPAELIMLDRDESALHAVQLSILGKALLDTDDVVLADIRDAQTIMNIFMERKPHVVFHAAALKHLPMLEQYPAEAVKTNVWGTLTVLEAARLSKVERFVNISTDKAANPISVLGYSKRLAEGLTAAIADSSEGTYLSVRFGNVLGSRGSVLSTFAAQIAAGGPVTVTHPEVTRFFMTVQEAVQLVIEAAAIGSDGEVLVLDMGEPVRIDAFARQLINLSGRSVDIEYTGLRRGEKINEDLFGEHEQDVRAVHPLVSHTAVPPLEPTRAQRIDSHATREALIACLAEMCGQLALTRTPLVAVSEPVEEAEAPVSTVVSAVSHGDDANVA
jgi:FlaA1/EpsC-like NDP-sugar epimerase